MEDMTKGSPLRQILCFAFPVLLANLCQQAYRIADAAVVGRYLGKEALSSVVGASETLLFISISFFLGLSYGMPIITGQCFGAKDYINVRRSIGLSVLVISGLALPLMLTAGFSTEGMLHLMNTPENLVSGAASYMKVLFFTGVINVLLLLLISVIRVLGDSMAALFIMVCSCVLNIGLNVLFVAVFGWGIPGVAWATVTAQFIPMVLGVIYFCWKMPQFVPHFADLKWGWNFIWQHLRVAIPAGFQNVVVAFGTVIVQYAVNSLGEDAVGGISATAALGGLVYMPLFAIAAALSTFCAQNFGAQNLRRIIVGVRRTAVIIMVYAAVSTILVWIFAPFLATIFLPETADNAETIRYGIRFLRLLSPFYVVLGFLFICSPPLTGMGYPKAPFWSGIMEMIMRCACALVLTKFIGFDGACLAHPVAWFGAAVIVVPDYLRKIRKLKRDGIPVRIERATEL